MSWRFRFFVLGEEDHGDGDEGRCEQICLAVWRVVRVLSAKDLFTMWLMHGKGDTHTVHDLFLRYCICVVMEITVSGSVEKAVVER